MTRRIPPVPTVHGIDLSFRPASYLADQDPVSAIVQDIAGAHRRTVVREALTGADGGMCELDDTLLVDRLSNDQRIALGQIHPSLMGGEYLPERLAGEIEIARVTLDSTTRDVIRLSARRRRRGWVYRMVDEYDTTFELAQQSSVRTLTLAQLVHLLDTADGDMLDTAGHGVVMCWPRSAHLNGTDPGESADFVSVSSEVYPQLAEYYERRLALWAAEWRNEDEEGA